MKIIVKKEEEISQNSFIFIILTDKKNLFNSNNVSFTLISEDHELNNAGFVCAISNAKCTSQSRLALRVKTLHRHGTKCLINSNTKKS